MMTTRRTARQVATVLAAGAALLAAVFALRAYARGSDGGKTDYGRRRAPARVETATFAAGCFWKLEHAMRRVDGVISTTAGYAGGHTTDPTHAAVSAGRTGHAEAVRVEFDPAVVPYEKLLDAFWKSHDPAQFAVEPGEPAPPGRSIVFYHTEAQRLAAEASKQRVAAWRPGAETPTEIIPAAPFFPAEPEHQQYHERNGSGGSCRLR